MQQLTERLLSALDKQYNVTNMPVVVEIIGILEKTPISKEVLEATRLGKHINELRRKTADKNVAKRAKDLVRKWRDMIVPEAAGGNGLRTPLNKGHLSPGLPARKSQPASPASRVSSLSPETGVAPSPAVSPRLQGYSPAPGLDNGTAPAPPPPPPRGRGRPPKDPAAAAAAAPPHTPRPRGRPPKSKNKHKREASDLLPKSSPANKRLRKDSSEGDVDVDGPPRLNGCNHSQVPTHARTHKVKTTRELLQSIQQESSLDALRSKTLVSLGVVRSPDKSAPAAPTPSPSIPKPSVSKEIFKERMRRSVVTPSSPAESDVEVDVEKVSGSEQTPVKMPPPPPVRAETVEEILARLPPVDRDQISWSDEEDEYVPPQSAEVTEEGITRLLESHIEGLNGNRTAGARAEGAGPHELRVPLSAEWGTAPGTCPTDCDFREWHQLLSSQTYQGDLIHILPYVIID